MNALNSRCEYLGIYCLFLSFMGFACADMAPNSAESTNKNGGIAENIAYRCEVATYTSDGSMWVYRTDKIMNMMSQISVSVERDSESFGSLTLSKKMTDTFSDGNLTVTLTQLGSKKSISVEHNNVPLFASADNGWCSAYEINEDWNQTGPSSENSGPADSQWLANEFEIKLSPECENPCAFFVETNMAVARVEYEADGWLIGESKQSNDNFSLLYTFQQGGPRTITAIGYDYYDNAIISDSANIMVKETVTDNPTEPQPEPQPQNPVGTARLNVPYFYQYSNGIEGWATCQNSSAAMLLNYYGVNIHPDDITREFTRFEAQALEGMNYVYNTLATRYNIRGIDSLSNGTIADLRGALDQGKPVITHGFFTGGGHILVVVGYDDNGYYVNDPAGTWSQRWKGGYPNAGQESNQAGKGIYYQKEAFEIAILTWDGVSRGTAYLHIPR